MPYNQENPSEWFELPQNYIYISHLDNNSGTQGVWFQLPTAPESISDNMQSQFQATQALSRSAPVYTYNYSGPRNVQVTLQLHRDMMEDSNKFKSNAILGDDEDYTECLLRHLQAISLPRYNLQNKFVEPPMVSVRFSNEVFIKGIVNGGVSVTYYKPILKDGRYITVQVAFTISEVDPYDATTVAKNGGFRGLVGGLRNYMGFEDEGGRS